MFETHPFYRRDVLRAAALGGGVAALSGIVPAWAQPVSRGTVPTLPTLTGGDISLTVGEVALRVDGKVARGIGINGTVPGPLLRLREGQTARLRVTNALTDRASGDDSTSIHWHGLLVPFAMDGVPGISFPGIRAGETFDYAFPIVQSGTYWYHSHSGYQEQDGVYGPIVIEPAGAEPVAYDREHVLVLADHSPMRGATIYRKLKQMGGGYFNMQRLTLSGLLAGRDLSASERRDWARMRMDPADISDVTGSTYDFTVNGWGPFDNWTALFTPGERVRLRIINAAAQTNFNVRIPDLAMTVVQADGQNVRPVEVDELQIGVAETYDVVVAPGDRAYTFVSEAIDRSGLGRATLAPREGMSAPVPPLRPRPLLTMKDMGMDMDMAGTDHAGMAGMEAPGAPRPAVVRGVDPSAEQNASRNLWRLTGWTGPATTAVATTTGMDRSGMDKAAVPAGTVDHAAMGHAPATQATPVDHAAMGHAPAAAAPEAMPGMDHTGMAPAAPAVDAMPGMDHGAGRMAHDMRDFRNAPQVREGPGVQSISPMPADRTGDPPVGLEGLGHRVLVYRDLVALERNPDARAPSRMLELHLTGNMERYMWGFDGMKLSDPADPIPFRLNERVRVTLVNDTMMPHPIHLHGHFFELVTGHGAHGPRKHTINVPPGGRMTFDLTADAAGDWAFHCHNLYHMTAGMMRVVTVRPVAGDTQNEAS